ncbi:hypothetical protein ABEV34_04635 [Methylorubrum rhodesianum]|uniref:hypothetical protein n=1 Tax=Methylorubrum rhodesianum TaxID=29427 RepID=UPI003D266F92
MAARTEKIILRNTAHGLRPASSYDAELLAGLPLDCDVEAKRTRIGRSKAQAAWWLLCSRVANCLDEQHTSRSVSNGILIDLNMVEEELLFGGGVRRTPMSIADFTDEQLWALVEAGKRHTVETLIPGVNIDDLMKSRGRP